MVALHRWFGLFAGAFLAACQPTAVASARPALPDADSFDAKRAFADLTAFVQRGNRYYGAPGRDAALEAIASELKGPDTEIVHQKFPVAMPTPTGAQFTMDNLIVRQNPERRRRLILGSHWDTRLWAEEDADPAKRNSPIPGANDGSSGVAVVLEISRLIRRQPLANFGVDYVLFDGEEYGRPGNNDYCQGSQYFAKHIIETYPKGRPEAAIIMDMVGDSDLQILREGNSMENASWLFDAIWSTAHEQGETAFLTSGGLTMVDDQVPLLKAGIPSVLLIDYTYPQWHTQGDTIDKCSPQSLARVGNVILATLRKLDKAADSSGSTR